VRNIKRGREGVERGGTPSQQGRTAPRRAHPTWLMVSQQEHMNNDALIIGFIFEPKDEGIRYMKHSIIIIPL
jgi:hypothetical protein